MARIQSRKYCRIWMKVTLLISEKCGECRGVVHNCLTPFFEITMDFGSGDPRPFPRSAHRDEHFAPTPVALRHLLPKSTCPLLGVRLTLVQVSTTLISASRSSEVLVFSHTYSTPKTNTTSVLSTLKTR